MADEATGSAGNAADVLGEAGTAGGGASGGEGTGGSGQGGGASSGDIGGGADPDWFMNLSGESADDDNPSNRDYVKGKNFKTLDDVVKSYREAERAVRDGGRVKVPGEGATAEDVAAYRKAIGVPDKVDGYEIKGPVNDDGSAMLDSYGRPIALDTDLIGKLAESALKGGTPKAAFEGLVSDFVKMQLDAAAETDRSESAKAAAVKKSWGADGDAKMLDVETGIKAMALDKDQVRAFRNLLGGDKAMELFQKIGSGMSEDSLFGTRRANFGTSAVEAQAKMDAAKADPEFRKQLAVKGSSQALQWAQWQAIVGEEENRKARAENSA